MNQPRIKKKKIRSENWCQSDKNLLRGLILPNLPIIENKSCDTNTNNLKKKCWDHILTLFNAKSETKRRAVQLLFQWRGMKLKAKKDKSILKKEPPDTDDMDVTFVPPPEDIPEDDDELAELIDTKPYEFVTDSTKFEISEPEAQFLDSIEPKQEESEENSELDANDVSERNGVFTPSLSDLPKANTSRPRPVRKYLKKLKKKNNEENNFKFEIFELTKLHMTKEHEQRMEVLRLEQECRMKELRKYDLEIEMLERETLDRKNL